MVQIQNDARSKWIYKAFSENLWCILVDFSAWAFAATLKTYTDT